LVLTEIIFKRNDFFFFYGPFSIYPFFKITIEYVGTMYIPHMAGWPYQSNDNLKKKKKKKEEREKYIARLYLWKCFVINYHNVNHSAMSIVKIRP
jgi:hypothetical protein